MPIADPPIKLASKKCGTLLHFRMVAVKFTPQIMLLSSHVKWHTKPHCSWLPRLMAFMRDRVRKNTVAGCAVRHGSLALSAPPATASTAAGLQQFKTEIVRGFNHGERGSAAEGGGVLLFPLRFR